MESTSDHSDNDNRDDKLSLKSTPQMTGATMTAVDKQATHSPTAAEKIDEGDINEVDDYFEQVQ
jgi:hypothetical protein